MKQNLSSTSIIICPPISKNFPLFPSNIPKHYPFPTMPSHSNYVDVSGLFITTHTSRLCFSRPSVFRGAMTSIFTPSDGHMYLIQWPSSGSANTSTAATIRPRLYSIQRFSRRPTFTCMSSWYSDLPRHSDLCLHRCKLLSSAFFSGS